MSNQSNQSTIELTLKVAYDLNGESPKYLMDNLERMVSRAIGEGALTGSSEAEVDVYSVSTRIVDQPTASEKAAPAVIEAKLLSDDKVFVATFDAVEYFKQASIDRLRDLADCGFGGDYPADGIAEFFQGKNPDVDAVFDYLSKIRDIPSKKDVCGFECYVDQDHAVAWLKENRIDALSSLSAGDWRISLKKGDQVYWKDPDSGFSSGYYQIAGINDEYEVVSNEDTMLILSNESGSISEVFASEILQSAPAKKMRP